MKRGRFEESEGFDFMKRGRFEESEGLDFSTGFWAGNLKVFMNIGQDFLAFSSLSHKKPARFRENDIPLQPENLMFLV